MKVIILGAGASKGTINAPTSAEFGKYLHVNNYLCDYPNLRKKIRFLVTYPQIFFSNGDDVNEYNWPLDKIHGAMDNRYKLRDIMGWTKEKGIKLKNRNMYKKKGFGLWDFAGYELRRAMLRVYGYDTNNKINSLKKDGSVINEFQLLKQGDCVVDFNYDMLSEKTLSKIDCDWIKINGLLSDEFADKKITLCKLHGSVAWIKRSPENGRGLTILEDPMKEEQYDYDDKLISTSEPGIVGLGPFKSELIMPEAQNDVPVFYNTLIAQWKFALRKIRESNEIVIMGYGFPPEDYHSQFMFSDAVACRNERRYKKISFYQTEKSASLTMCRLRSLFKVESGRQIVYCGPVK